MALDFADRRMNDRRQTRGPDHVLVLRGQLVEHHMEDQVEWSEVAKAAHKIADFAERQQAKAWQRVKGWDR